MQQLVLQFSPWGVNTVDLDRLISLEEQLVDALTGKADVDGHDMGMNEANIFIHTHDAHAAFMTALTIVERSGLSLSGAAYRQIGSDEYTRLWPEGDATAFTVK